MHLAILIRANPFRICTYTTPSKSRLLSPLESAHTSLPRICTFYSYLKSFSFCTYIAKLANPFRFCRYKKGGVPLQPSHDAFYASPESHAVTMPPHPPCFLAFPHSHRIPKFQPLHFQAIAHSAGGWGTPRVIGHRSPPFGRRSRFHRDESRVTSHRLSGTFALLPRNTYRDAESGVPPPRSQASNDPG